MKLSWKIFISTLIITIFTFSIGGYILISAVFHSSFDRENRVSLEENKILRNYFEALIPNTSLKNQDYISTTLESMVSHFANDKLTIRIFNEDGDTIVQSEDLGFNNSLFNQVKENSLAYTTVKHNDKYYIQTASVLLSLDNKIYLETFHDISSIFTERQNLFSFYRKLMIFMLGANGILIFFMTLWTIRPIKKLSNATREIAKGKYGNRVAVGTKDEIGLLAEDFNKMTDSLENKIRDLEETAISQKEFIGSFAHEIKTPLTSIIGYADMLRSKKMSEEHRILAANYIFNEGKRLETLSLKLLDLLVVKNHDFEMEQVNVKELFNDIQDSMAPIFADSNIIFQITAEDVEIQIEPDLIKIFIINLLDNAKKAIGEKGKISLDGKAISDDQFMITIKDNGKGIPEEELSRITEVFYTVDKSRTRNSGVGIGLALCREITEFHGGEMKFESQVDIGTCVYLYLRR